MIMKKIYFLLAFVLIAGFGFGQTTIAFQGFEGTGSDSWTIVSGSSYISTSIGSSDTPSSSRIRTDSHSWQVKNATRTLELNSVDVSSYSSVKVTVHVSSTSETSGNGADGTDYVRVYTNVSGAGFPGTADIELKGNSNARWTYSANLTKSTPAGTNVSVSAPQGGTSVNNYAILEITIPSGATSVAFKLIAKNNSSSEHWNIDDIAVTGSVTTTDPEPTNHATGFSATTNSSSQITVNWTDAVAGSQAPSEYLVKAAVDPASPTSPVDGTAESDATLVKNILYGVETAVFTGLSASTTYNFEIWPYTNSGSNIDYKTDGIIPTANATTDVAPTVSKIIISEMCDPKNNYAKDRFIEITNLETSSVDLTDYTIDAIGNGSVIHTWTLSGTIAAGESLTCGDDANTVTLDFEDADWSSDDGSWNGGTTDGARLKFNGTTIDEALGMSYGNKTVIRRLSVTEPTDSYVSSEWATITVNDVTETAIGHHINNWTGATSNAWATSSNWSEGVVMSKYFHAVINTSPINMPTISAASSVYDLLIKSDANGDASLIGQENLTVNGTATVERYVTRSTSATNGWHFLSSPVANYTISGSDFDPANGTEDLYRWGESIGKWLNYTGGTFSHTEFEVGLGYLVAYNASEVKTFTGALNTADVTKNLTYNAGKGDGWNLIGNPFPSAIDADALTFSGAVNSAVYVVNPADGTYWAHNGLYGDDPLAGGEIPVNQGFFVEATGSGASVEIALADQVHSTNDFNKKDRALPKESLVVTLIGQTSENSTYFQFRDDATNEFDGNADAYKLFGWASIAQVYSKLGDTEYSINCLPHSTEAVMVPLGIKLSADEDLTLDFSGLETFFNTIRIDLEDTKTGMTLNVRENPSYSFHGEVADNPTRFILHFNGVTGIDDEMQETPAPQVYAVNQAIYINSSQDLTADVLIYNINGQLVGQDKINGEQLKRLELKTAMGMYLVTVKTADAVYTEKVMIK
jgi:hypothetical protein